MQEEVFVIRKNYKNLDHGLESAYLQGYMKLPGDTETKKDSLKVDLQLPEIDSSGMSKKKVEICYEQYSRKGNEKWVLFVNGFSSSVNLWKFQKGEFLRQGYNLVLFDLLGQGSSSKPAGVRYSLEGQIRIMEEIVKKTPLKENPFFLIGISAGGTIAQVYAHRHPEQLKAMVLLATFPKTDGSIEFQNEITLKIVDNDKLPDQDKKELLSYQVMSNIFSDYFCRNFKPTLMNLIRENSQRNTVDSYRGAYYMLKDFDATSLLPEIKTPTLIFSALHDRIVETHHSYTLNQLLPNSQRYILKGVSASHTFVMELFETFNDVLLEELKKTKYFQGSRLSVYVENEWVQEKTKEQMLEIHI